MARLRCILLFFSLGFSGVASSQTVDVESEHNSPEESQPGGAHLWMNSSLEETGQDFCGQIRCTSESDCENNKCPGSCSSRPGVNGKYCDLVSTVVKNCGKECSNNMACAAKGAECAYCYAGRCTNQKVANCGNVCKRDRDCSSPSRDWIGNVRREDEFSDQNSNQSACRFCEKGGCWPYRPYNGHKCGNSCELPSDCEGADDGCGFCDISKGMCAVYSNKCSASCNRDKDCPGGTCSICDRNSKKCVPSSRHNCGNFCFEDSMCRNNGSANFVTQCPTCGPKQQCTFEPPTPAPSSEPRERCNEPCKSDVDCPGETCSTCDFLQKKCVVSGPDNCDHYCYKDSMCRNNGSWRFGTICQYCGSEQKCGQDCHPTSGPTQAPTSSSVY